ncbi:MAG: iron ABC transporter permease, partial [Acidobacteria bacterium]|nr:iron ABC transporter permease [Acidobacteriota bacterium]
MGAGLAVVVLIAVICVGIGSVYVPPASVARIVLDKVQHLGGGGTPETWNIVIWDIRFPRIVLAGLVGAALALSGAAFQGLFHNDLADPYLLGAASGAGLGATIVLTSSFPIYLYGVNLLPAAAFAGSLLAVGTACAVARRSSGTPTATLILAGVAVASLAGAMTSLLMIRSSPDVRPVLAWLLGGFAGRHWREVWIMLPYLCAGAAVLLAYGRILNILQLGEEEARQLGVNVRRSRPILIAFATLMTAAAVSVSGMIGFVGLIAPHAVRRIWGRDYRFVLPMSMLAGSALLILADLVARIAASPAELPVGVVTALCG